MKSVNRADRQASAANPKTAIKPDTAAATGRGKRHRPADDKPASAAKADVVATKKKPSGPAKTRSPGRPRSRGRTRLSPEAIEEMFHLLEQDNPEPKGELEYVNPFTLLVAVVLSAQATDAGVNKATRALFKIADTPEKMVRLNEEGIREYIKTIGLYRTKARNVLELSRQLIANHGSEVPRAREALEALPGVGRKTANVVLNIAFGEPTMAVDTHVFRIANRTGLSSGRNPLEVEEDLLRVIPQRYALHAHHWLILLGRYVCKARKPECPRCVVREICLFEPKTM
ncbi:endonuclease III [Hyphomicrobium sulfonivorans]|nr:endonuclease III [Hyphomicrobium sulfonivorans]NSL70895.1 endonuclease III [Hyphomicrobium sulfonivorans]